MNIFTKDFDALHFLRNYGCVVLLPGDRAFLLQQRPLELLMTDRDQDSILRSTSKIGDSKRFIEKNFLPSYLHDFYPTIGIDITIPVGGRPNHNYMSRQFFLPNDEIRSYVIKATDAARLLDIFKSRVPRSFTKMSESTIKRFLKILNPEYGFDISAINFAPVKYTMMSPGSGWNERIIAEEYLVTDNNLNPIDTKALMEVLDKIVVDD